MSNAERQRQFQERHPGYDRRRKARRRGAATLEEQRNLAALAATAAEQTPAKPQVLMLPAPAVTVEIPGMTTLEATPARCAEELRPLTALPA